MQNAWKELTNGKSEVILRAADDRSNKTFPFFPAFYAVLYTVDGIRPSAVHAGGKVAQYVVGILPHTFAHAKQGTAFAALWGYDVTVVTSMHPKFISETPDPQTWFALLIQQCAGLILGQEYCPSAPTPPTPDLALVYRLLEAVIRHLPPKLRRKIDVLSGWRSSLQGWDIGPRGSVEQLLFAIIDWLREGNGKGFPPLARQETAPRLTVVSAESPGFYNCLDGELPAGKFNKRGAESGTAPFVLPHCTVKPRHTPGSAAVCANLLQKCALPPQRQVPQGSTPLQQRDSDLGHCARDCAQPAISNCTNPSGVL